MPNSPQSNTSVNIPEIADGRVCPRCGGELSRIKRRLLERIINPVTMPSRYQCNSFLCDTRAYGSTESATYGDSAADAVLDSIGCSCPRCGGETFRVQRKLMDLAISRISVVHRYQCDSRRCGWTGLVRQVQRTGYTRS